MYSAKNLKTGEAKKFKTNSEAVNYAIVEHNKEYAKTKQKIRFRITKE